MEVRTAQRRAIQRAISLGLAGDVRRLSYGWYRVPSTTTPGQAYTVRVVDGRFTCECSAGRSGRPCVHQAAVFIKKVEHASGGRVAGPATVAPGEAAPSNVLPFRQRAA